MLLYTEHTGQQCEGNGIPGNLGSIAVDVTGGDIGPCADECNSNPECVGFVYVANGGWGSACYLRLGAMGSPTAFDGDTRTCYERKPTADPTPSPTPTPTAAHAERHAHPHARDSPEASQEGSKGVLTISKFGFFPERA